jgi:hypothetical protein
MREAIDGLSGDQMQKPEAPGKWSICQVMQHLADSDLVWGYRVRMILSHDRPQIVGYDQDLWANRLHYDEADPDAALDQFDCLRRCNLALLRKTSEEDRQRVGVHSERGEESVEHLIRLYAGHDLLHLRQIARSRASLKSSV